MVFNNQFVNIQSTKDNHQKHTVPRTACETKQQTINLKQ